MMQRETELQEGQKDQHFDACTRRFTRISECERLRSSAEDMARKVEGRRDAQSDLEMARGAAESDFLHAQSRTRGPTRIFRHRLVCL